MNAKKLYEFLFYLWWTAERNRANLWLALDHYAYAYDQQPLRYHELAKMVGDLIELRWVSDFPIGHFAHWAKEDLGMPFAPILREHGATLGFALDITPLGNLELDEVIRTGKLTYYLKPPGPVSQGVVANYKIDTVPEQLELGGVNIEVVRKLLIAAFDDTDLMTLCFDHFSPVYNEFSAGMSKSEKVQLLLDYCVRHGQLEALLKLVEERNPYQYNIYADRIFTT